LRNKLTRSCGSNSKAISHRFCTAWTVFTSPSWLLTIAPSEKDISGSSENDAGHQTTAISSSVTHVYRVDELAPSRLSCAPWPVRVRPCGRIWRPWQGERRVFRGTTSSPSNMDRGVGQMRTSFCEGCGLALDLLRLWPPLDLMTTNGSTAGRHPE